MDEPKPPLTHNSQESFDNHAARAVYLLNEGGGLAAEADFKLAQLFWMDLVLEKINGLLVTMANTSGFHPEDESSTLLQPSILNCNAETEN